MTRHRGQRLGKHYPPPAPSLEREKRVPVSIRSWILFKGDRHVIEVRDLSEHGFGGYSSMALPIGSEITVELPGQGQRQAQVRWALCGQFGAKFVRHCGNAGIEQLHSRIASAVHGTA
jgi:hypothetical protein